MKAPQKISWLRPWFGRLQSKTNSSTKFVCSTRATRGLMFAPQSCKGATWLLFPSTYYQLRSADQLQIKRLCIAGCWVAHLRPNLPLGSSQSNNSNLLFSIPPRRIFAFAYSSGLGDCYSTRTKWHIMVWHNINSWSEFISRNNTRNSCASLLVLSGWAELNRFHLWPFDEAGTRSGA